MEDIYAQQMKKFDTGKMAGAKTDRGHNQSTAGGKAFYVLDPKPGDISIHDIASQLARICRFGGALHWNVSFYSVAQHSCLVSDHCPDELKLEGLLHDAHEAYIGDMLKPMKLNMAILGLDWKLIEHPLELAIRKRFGLPQRMSPEVKHQDYLAVATEHLQLQKVTGEVDWGELPTDTWSEPIEPWEPARAREEFLERFFKLY